MLASVWSAAMAIVYNEEKLQAAHEAVLDAVVKQAPSTNDPERIRKLAEAVALLQGTARSTPSSSTG